MSTICCLLHPRTSRPPLPSPKLSKDCRKTFLLPSSSKCEAINNIDKRKVEHLTDHLYADIFDETVLMNAREEDVENIFHFINHISCLFMLQQ